MKARDLTDERFGRLVAVRDVGTITKGKATGRAWLWRCDCGAEFTDWPKSIVGGRKVSCGCRRRETLGNVSKMTHERAARHNVNLVGRKFGRLEVTASAGTSKQGLLWKCVCDCGNVIDNANSASLTGGMRVSCGCQQREAGLRNLALAQDARRYIMAAKRSRLLSGILFKPHIRPRAPSVVHRVKD